MTFSYKLTNWPVWQYGNKRHFPRRTVVKMYLSLRLSWFIHSYRLTKLSVCGRSAYSCYHIATDCVSLSSLQWELMCSQCSSKVYSAVGVGCHMRLHVRLLQEHTAAAAGRRPALLSAVRGQYWLFCEAVWVRLSDSPFLFPYMLNHSLIASLFFHCSWQSTCITADDTALLLSLMPGSTVTCLVFVCLYKALSCIVIFYRCIRYLWTKQLINPIYRCTHMANW